MWDLFCIIVLFSIDLFVFHLKQDSSVEEGEEEEDELDDESVFESDSAQSLSDEQLYHIGLEHQPVYQGPDDFDD